MAEFNFANWFLKVIKIRSERALIENNQIILLMLLIFHDLVKEGDPGSQRNLLHRVSLRQVLNRLQLVIGYVAVKFPVIFEGLLVLDVIDLTPRWADRFAAEVFKRVQQLVVVLHI